MSARDRLFLQHMQDAMREIQDFTQGGRDEFMADDTLPEVGMGTTAQ